MCTFKTFFENVKGSRKLGGRFNAFKGAITGQKHNMTYKINQRDTHEETNAIDNLRKHGGSTIFNHAQLENFLKQNYNSMPNIPTKPGESLNLGRSGESTHQITLTLVAPGKYQLTTH